MQKNTPPKKIPRGSFYFCIVLGIAFIAISFIYRSRTEFSADVYTKLSATVTSYDGNNTTVDYSYEGKDYHDIYLRSFYKDHFKGQNITIYIYKTSPTYATTHERYDAMFKWFLIAGSVVLVLGIAGMVLRRIILGRVDEIIEGGKYIYADVDKVVYETNITNDAGLHPYIIYCHYEDFKGVKKHDYVLYNIYTKPYDYLEANKNKVKVYIKGNNYKKYSFDPAVIEEESEPNAN